MSLLHALLLGILQGITNYFPISSSAHLILAPALAGWADQGVAFDLAVHVGTLLAVILYFPRDVTTLTRDGVVSMTQRRFIGQGRMALFLIIGTLPAAVAGLLLLDLIDNQLRSVQIIFSPRWSLACCWAGQIGGLTGSGICPRWAGVMPCWWGWPKPSH
ncbi:MAG: undecaprenyl-diphosphate phosphatase [Halioglobus sp.]|nr:undecaprenyl-diphosphate phosphatase [Halioglobus sp.]